MALLQWKDQYSVGIEAVDHEHRELIDLINKFPGLLDDPKGGHLGAFRARGTIHARTQIRRACSA